jgi:hypothetical protein
MQRPDHVGARVYDAPMSEQPRDAELAAQAREERLADIRARTSWAPEHDPDPVIRRMYRESQEQLRDELTHRKGA